MSSRGSSQFSLYVNNTTVPNKKRYSTPIYAPLYLSSCHNICHHPCLSSRGLPPGTRLLLQGNELTMTIRQYSHLFTTGLPRCARNDKKYTGKNNVSKMTNISVSSRGLTPGTRLLYTICNKNIPPIGGMFL